MVLGAVFLSLFGATWLAGASYAYLGASPPVLSAIALASLLIVAWAIQTFRARHAASTWSPDRQARKQLRKSIIIVNVVQWSIIGVAVLLLNVIGHVEWIMPSVIFVVGVHFLPLANIVGYRGYYLTALGLVMVAAVSILIGNVALSLLAAGAILWISAIALLSRR